VSEGGGRYDGVDAAALARRLGVPRVAAFDEVDSTMDVAHALAADGAPAGTVVLADAQRGGRGRGGRRWASHPGVGIWLTLVERPRDTSGLDVLSLRLGLHAAAAGERFATEPVRLKWPNDLYVGEGKLAGVLVEVRWRDGRPEWVAIGFGMNVRAPADVPAAAGLAPGTERLAVLAALVPVLRSAAAARGPLAAGELAAFAARDMAVGRAVSEPVPGVVRGIGAGGELLVADAAGRVTAARHGSLVFAPAGGSGGLSG
jgi:BirA family biotin operon repressor/biotin-[acetyl-CoA-carboxylase] ligase